MSDGRNDTEPVRLLADIGGTNARFALLRGSVIDPQSVESVAVADFPGVGSAIESYLAARGVRPVEAGIAIANPVIGDHVHMTNHSWSFSIEQTRVELGLERLEVINDFTALALALPHLDWFDYDQVGTGSARPRAPIGLLGAGTGLGVSGLLPSGDRWVPIAGEGGHVTMAACDEREAAILAQVRRSHPHVSAERVLSGMGLENLYAAIAELNGVPAAPVSAAEVTSRALRSMDRCAVEALEAFCAMLGTVAGNLALTLGATGGVYIGGGIVPRLGAFFSASRFRRRFEEKGRFADYLAAIPTFVIRAANPAFIGVAAALGIEPESPDSGAQSGSR